MNDAAKTAIGAVVVLYNPTEKEINNINTYKDLAEQTVIIDNSDDNHRPDVDRMVMLNNKVHYYTEQKNLGLCKALNIGVEMLMKAGCKWALVLDADSEIESDIFKVYKNAIEYFNCNNVAVFVPLHVFDRHNVKPYEGYKEVEWGMTSGCLFNCEIFKTQNGFKEELFVDGLDMDYSFKSHENGYRIIECGAAVINHHPAMTRYFLGFRYGIDSPERYYMQARALIWCWKRYKKTTMFLFYIYKWIKVLFLFPDKTKYISKMIKGTKDGNRLLREIWYES